MGESCSCALLSTRSPEGSEQKCILQGGRGTLVETGVVFSNFVDHLMSSMSMSIQSYVVSGLPESNAGKAILK